IVSGSSLDDIKSKKVGDGQYGTARWATDDEKYKMYRKVPFGKEMTPGFVVETIPKQRLWVTDVSDQNLLQVAPPGAGKTKFCIIPTVYYNALVNKHTGRGASLILTDCKGELYATCGEMLRSYGYRIPFLDFRNPLRSYRFNLLYNVNKYIDRYKKAESEEDKLISYGRAERYAKVLSESIIDNIDSAQTSEASQYFKETAKGLLTGIILLVSEYGDAEERHIISVFQLIIELNGLDEGSSDVMQRSKLEQLLTHVDNPRLINYVGPAMKADARTSMNVFSSALGKLVSFIDAELEQMVCGHSQELGDVDFINHPTAIFLICPDENTTRHFFASLYIRYMMNDLIEQASHTKDLKLARDVLCIWDEFGNMPPVKNMDVLLTAARSRGIRFFISLQSFFQLEKSYSQRSAKILRGACQLKMYTYLADEEEAKSLSEALGDRTVQSGSVSRSTRDGMWTDSSSQSIQMIRRRLMTPDEIMSLPQGEFI
ncbi:MAG: VirD4-like conjugal transfer protein, CD1115 family, partial [Acetanaerobacterium sp.]